MKKSTKIIICLALVGSILLSANQGNGAGALKLILFYAITGGGLYLAWRVYVFLALLLQPVREKLAPVVDPVTNHVDATLRRSGLGKVADISKKLQAGLNGAVAATQREIDDRNK